LRRQRFQNEKSKRSLQNVVSGLWHVIDDLASCVYRSYRGDVVRNGWPGDLNTRNNRRHREQRWHATAPLLGVLITEPDLQLNASNAAIQYRNLASDNLLGYSSPQIVCVNSI
jgi:hypothetical protein